MILCADDFGLNDPVSEGILNLVKNKKINSISCLVTTSCWGEKATHLQPFLNNVEIGLHLSLTYPKPFLSSSQSLYSLIKKSYFRQLKKNQIALEIHAQIEKFKESLGQMPCYIDGHEFCHQFPIIREALIEVAQELSFKKNNIYIRVFKPKKLLFKKPLIFWFLNHLVALPSKKMISLLRKKNISFNEGLLGFHPYPIKPKTYFDYYLKTKPSEKDIFFCHPGLPSLDSSDKLRHYRPQIYNFMMSVQFDELLQNYKLFLKSRCI